MINFVGRVDHSMRPGLPSALDCSLCEAPPSTCTSPRSQLAICCEEPDCSPQLVPNQISSQQNEIAAAANACGMSWDEMMSMDDCRECATLGSAHPVGETSASGANNFPLTKFQPQFAAALDPCCVPWGNAFDVTHLAQCCEDDCLDEAGLSTITPTDSAADCPDCLTCPNSGSTSPATSFLSTGQNTLAEHFPTNPSGLPVLQDSGLRDLGELLKGLDSQSIQDILNCCCCAPELETDRENWTPARHATHQDLHSLNFPLAAHPPLMTSSIPNTPLPCPTFTCQWTGCGISFTDKNLLVAHVNQFHLAAQPAVEPTYTQSLAFTPLNRTWNDCTPLGTPPLPLMMPFQTPNSTSPILPVNEPNLNLATTTLLQHLVKDHLNKFEPNIGHALSASLAQMAAHQQIQSQSEKVSTNSQPARKHSAHTHKHLHKKHHHHHHTHQHSHPYGVHSRASSLAPSATPTPSLSGSHACKWKNCSLLFESSADLMNHLSVEHIGSGQGSYSCEWEGCDRNLGGDPQGGKLFTQRQKVMRHLQTHTGDRPFACEICGKTFSEAMTLTQHLRVHTNEKPYKCSHPHCDKSFALASALTIHMRTHTGDKPFPCPYPDCMAAFAESSNLAKHIRTHKGEKTHSCPECSKSFARSDQLARHRKIHEKKRKDEKLIQV